MDPKFIQGVLYLVFIIFLTFILYGYIIHLYRSEKKGEKDYEKYGKLALDDELTSKPLEAIEEENKKESK
jgi:cytochrome c oxidase cbb3-type subunit 4